MSTIKPSHFRLFTLSYSIRACIDPSLLLLSLTLYLFSQKNWKFKIISLINKWNKIFQQPSHSKIAGSTYTKTKTAIIYHVTKVLKILFKCVQKSYIKDMAFTNSTVANLKILHSYITFQSFKWICTFHFCRY